MRNNGKAVLIAVLVGLSVVLSGCIDEKTGKVSPELPNNLTGVPILQGLQEASKLLP